MTATEPDVLDLLRAIDPLAESVDADVDPQRLAGVRHIIELRRETLSPRVAPSGARRRWRVTAIVLAAVLATPVGLVVLIPGAASRLGVPWGSSAALLGSEAADRLCDGGGGDSALIPPADASLRLWPGELPSGWSVEKVIARDIKVSTAGCVTPSMMLVETAGDGLVVGAVNVIGPRKSVHYSGDPEFTPDRVAGFSAREVVYRGMGGPKFRRWVVTGPGDLEWEVNSIGYAEPRAREIVDRLSFTTTHVDYPTEAGSPMSVLYRRPGPPYPDRTSGGLEWFVYLRDSNGQTRHLLVRRTTLALPLGSNEIGPGMRLLQVNGQPAVEDSRSLTVEVRPGTLASVEVHDDLAVVERLLTSLVNLDPADPRLSRYALDEDYGG